MEFFRLNDKVIVKDIERIQQEIGKENVGYWCYYGKTYMMAYYKHDTYIIFNGEEMFNLVWKQGTIVGGIYEKYLQVKIDNKIYNLPHFALTHKEE